MANFLEVPIVVDETNHTPNAGTRPDTGQLRARVEQLERTIGDRPTRAEVQVMIVEQVEKHISALRTSLEAERRAFYERQEETERQRDKTLDRMEKLIESLSTNVVKRREDMDRKFESFDHRLDSVNMLVNQQQVAIYGTGGDGPASLFKIVGDLKLALEAQSEASQTRWQQMDARIASLETVLRVVDFLKTKTGRAVIVAALTVLGLNGLSPLIQAVQ